MGKQSLTCGNFWLTVHIKLLTSLGARWTLVSAAYKVKFDELEDLTLSFM